MVIALMLVNEKTEGNVHDRNTDYTVRSDLELFWSLHKVAFFAAYI